MCILQAFGNLLHVDEDGVDGEHAPRRIVVLEGAIGRILEHEIWKALVFRKAEDQCDMWMVPGRDLARLVQQRFALFWGGVEQYFDSYLGAQIHLLGLIDDAKRAAPDFAHQAIISHALANVHALSPPL